MFVVSQGRIYAQFATLALGVTTYGSAPSNSGAGLPFTYDRGTSIEPDTYFINFAKASDNTLLVALGSEGPGTANLFAHIGISIYYR